MYYDAEGAVHNDVAESIETDDGQTYTIKIKDDQTFTNGDPVTAESFVDAWNYGARSRQRAAVQLLLRVDRGLQLRRERARDVGPRRSSTTSPSRSSSSQPESDFPLRLGYSAFFPLPAAAFEDIAAFGENPIGNGPYMLDGEGAWKHNERIDLVVNPDYNGDRKAQNGGLDVILYADTEAAYADLQAGNLDVLQDHPRQRARDVRDGLRGPVGQPARRGERHDHDPRPPGALRAVKRASCVAPRSRTRSTARRSPT